MSRRGDRQAAKGRIFVQKMQANLVKQQAATERSIAEHAHRISPEGKAERKQAKLSAQQARAVRKVPKLTRGKVKGGWTYPPKKGR